MAKRQVYIAGVRERLALWNAQIDGLGTKSDGHATAEQKKVEGWKAGTGAIAERLAELEALDRKWYATRIKVEEALRVLGAELGQADVPLGDAAAAPTGPSTTRRLA